MSLPTHVFDSQSHKVAPRPAAPSGEVPRDRRIERRHSGSGSATLFWLDESSELRSAPVKMQNVSAEGMAVATPASIAVGETVRLRSELSESRASVRYCRKQEAGFSVGLRLVPQERRRGERLSASGAGYLTWTESSGRQRTTVVKAKNISDEGMQVEVPRDVGISQLQQDELVKVWGSTYECVGRLRFRQPSGPSCVLGIEFVRPAHRKDCLEFRD